MYNPKKAQKIETIPAGEVVDGVIIKIDDGTPRNFLKNDEQVKKFKNVDEPAINVVVDFKYKDRVLRCEQLFSYINGANDTMLYTDNSNLGKFVKQYGKLPQVADFVKLSSNAQGFFKIIF